jgi:hypothetical protein
LFRPEETVAARELDEVYVIMLTARIEMITVAASASTSAKPRSSPQAARFPARTSVAADVAQVVDGLRSPDDAAASTLQPSR